MEKTFTFEKFDSLASFIGSISSRPLNSVYSPYKDYLSSEGGTRSFTGTASYGESLDLLAKGYQEGLDNMLSSSHGRVNPRSYASKSIPSSGPTGYAPIVANAIVGLPNSMAYKKSIVRKSKVVRIWYNPTMDRKVSTENVTKAGRNILDVIMTLEKQGYRVELDVINLVCSSKQVVGYSVKVKTDRQPVNPLKISYPLLHASWLRRQGFKWMETTSLITDKGFVTGYGYALHFDYEDCDKRREVLRAKGILPGNCFYTDFYEASRNDPEQLIRLMGLR